VVEISDERSTSFVEISEKEEGTEEVSLMEELRGYEKPSAISIFRINKVNLSLMDQTKEVLAIYLSKLKYLQISKGSGEQVNEYTLGHIQIDNQATTDPLFPVIL